MREKILLVGHGSRNEAGNREIEAFAKQWQEQNSQWKIDLCFIELATPLLDEGLSRAAESADRVIVVPLILNAAGHVKEEIPEFIEAAAEQYPKVEFRYATNLGPNDAVLAVMKRSLRKVLAGMNFPDPRKTGVVLLARGSSDRHANGDVAMMARWIYEEAEVEQMDIAFTGITHPRLESVVQRQIDSGMTQIAVLPYYLFTGSLIERIRKQVDQLQQHCPEIQWGLGDYFGFEEEIFQILNRRVHEAQSREQE